MEQYMEISHSIMTEIYNMSTYDDNYDFVSFHQNREDLAELLNFVEKGRNNLIIKKENYGIDFILVSGKSNYISEKTTLFKECFDKNMIKSKLNMLKFHDLLIRLECLIGQNDLLMLEKQRGFVPTKKQNDDHFCDLTDDELDFYKVLGNDVDENLEDCEVNKDFE